MLSEVSRIQYFPNSRSSLKVFVTTVDDRNPALPGDPQTMGIMVYSLLWVMQGLNHQPYGQHCAEGSFGALVLRVGFGRIFCYSCNKEPHKDYG